ncbi:hypothetical protein AB6C47_018215 [Vibrio cyclitrophicus]
MLGLFLKRNSHIKNITLSFVFAFLLCKMSFNENFNVPITSKEIKRRHKRNQFTKNKTETAFFIILITTLLSFSTAHSFVGQGIINADNYIVMSAFYDFFPTIKPVYIESQSAVNDLASDTIGVLTRAVFQIVFSLMGIIIPFLLLKVILIFKADNEVDSGEISKLVLFLLLVGSMGVYSIEHKTKSGLEYKTTIMQHMAFTYFGNVLEKLEENGNKDYEQKYLIPEVKLGDLVSQQSSFDNFTKSYLANDFKKDDFFEFAVSKIESENGFGSTYMANIELGSDHLQISFKSNQKQINNADKFFGIDLQKKEEELVMNYFQSMVDHAVKVKQRVSHFTFINGAGSYSIFDDTPSFEGNYTQYCDSIYETSKINMDMATFNKYLGVSSMCASAKFVKDNYNNRFYSYDSENRIRDGYTMIFGDSILDEKMKLSDIIANTKSICLGGYFACTEALQFATKRYMLNQKDVGMLTPVIREIDELTQSFEDNADDFIQSLTFDKSLSLSKEFTDKFSEGLPISYVNGQAISGDYDLNTLTNLALLLDPTDIKLPNTDELTSIFVGKDWAEPFMRMKTCFSYAGMVKDGFRCKTATHELRDMGLSMLHMGVDLYLMTKVASVPLQAGMNKIKGKGKPKNKELNIGKGSFIKDNFGEFAVVGTSLAGLSASENMFKNTPYYSSESVMGLAAVNTFFNMFGQREINPLNKASKWLILGGLGIMAIVYALIWILVCFFKKLTEIIVEVVSLPLICTVSILNGGFAELWNRVREFYFDTVILILYVFVLSIAAYHRDTIINIQVRHMLDNINNLISDSGWSNLLANLDMIVYTVIIFVIIVFKAINESLNNSGVEIESNIKN